MYQQKCPIYRNSKAVRDMVLLLMFPITSAGGHKYRMVAVELDGNYIDAEPMKSRSARELTEAYKRIYARWKATGVICPNWHILDNKAPEEFLEAIREN
jgi:hypothetical protein